MGKVIDLPVITTLALDADKTLKKLDGKLDAFILAGYDKDGKEFFSTTFADMSEALWVLERCKSALLSHSDD